MLKDLIEYIKDFALEPFYTPLEFVLVCVWAVATPNTFLGAVAMFVLMMLTRVTLYYLRHGLNKGKVDGEKDGLC